MLCRGVPAPQCCTGSLSAACCLRCLLQALDAALGMLYLHSRPVPVLHRDLVGGLASWICFALHALLCKEVGRQRRSRLSSWVRCLC